MTTFSPTWDDISSAFVTTLKSNSLIDDASYMYPLSAIANDCLPYACVQPPEMALTPLTFGATTITYSGDLHLLVCVIDTDTASIGAVISNQCASLGLELLLSFQNREQSTLEIAGTDTVTYASLNGAEIGRFSPYSNSNMYSYAGVTIPYQISMQYKV